MFFKHTLIINKYKKLQEKLLFYHFFLQLYKKYDKIMIEYKF